MVCNIFVLGRTGSGKSTAARFLRDWARQEGWSCQSFNDYYFLREMFENDTERRFFRATEHGGFEVLDSSVFQLAIRSLAQQVQSYCPVTNRTLLTIEFTSNNYRDALQLFDASLRRNASFLFLAADLKTCLDRTSKRAFNALTEDDYHVIDNVLLRHYPSPYMPLHIDREKVTFVNNMGSMSVLRSQIQNLVSDALKASSSHALPETSPVPA